MGALSTRLDADIAAQLADVDRIKQTAKTELANAQARLQALQQARLALTPELEAVIDSLASVGIKVSING